MAPNLAPNIVAKSLQERWAQLRSHKRVISKVKLHAERGRKIAAIRSPETFCSLPCFGKSHLWQKFVLRFCPPDINSLLGTSLH